MEGFFDAPSAKLLIPLSTVAKCGACGYYKGCTSPKQKVQGFGRKRILIVGDFPDQLADAKGLHIAGDERNYLRAKLAEAGISLKRDCWLTSALICKPTGKHTKKDATLFCRPNLMNAIKRLKPTVIVLMGEYALELLRHLWREDATAGKDAIDSFVGFCIPVQKINTWVCPVYNPKFLMKMNHKVLDLLFVRQMKKVKEVCGDVPWNKVPDYPSQVNVAFHNGAFYDFVKKRLKDGKTFAFDYETNSLKPEGKETKITHVSVSDGETTVATFWHGEMSRVWKNLLTERYVLKIASNMKFEHRWTKVKLGFDVQGWDHDTMLSSHVLDNRGGIASIKFQAFVQLGQAEWDSKIHPFLKAGEKGGYALNRIDQAPQRELLIYNGMDSLMEYKVAKKQKRLLAEEM